jgi:hypothetical protein
MLSSHRHGPPPGADAEARTFTFCAEPMPPFSSGYYPPRARWYSRFYYLWQNLCRWLPLGRVRLPGGFNLRQFLVALVVPGYAYRVLHQPRIARIVLASYGFMVLVAVVGLGTAPGTLAYGLMVALHAVSLAGVLGSWLEPGGLRRRILLALFSTLLIGVMVYYPLQRWIQSSLVMPLRIGNQDLMLVPDHRVSSLRPGVVRVFRFGGVAGVQGVLLGQGYVVAEVRGGPGDRIRFDHENYTVNGRSYPTRPLMPQTGEWLVPENHWFIWPDSSIRVTGALPAMDSASRDTLLRAMALVPSSRVVGRPLRWWFWRNLYVP